MNEEPTIRDLFAVLALSGRLANPNNERPGIDRLQGWVEAQARLAYQLADACLAHRSTTTEKE
jgi:hypothetical protein